MLKTRWSIAAAVVVASLAGSSPALAHQSPPGCNTGASHVDLTGASLNVVHRNGDPISIVAKVSNDAPGACDVTDATLKIAFPNADGTPGATEQVVGTGIDLPAGTTPKALPAVEGTVNFDPAVFQGNVKATLTGTFHWIGTHTPDAFLVGLEQPIVVTHPHAKIKVTPVQTLGQVTYKYAVENDSAHDPHPGAADPNIFDIALTDDRCGPIPAAHAGDTNMDDVMEPGETWTYQCTTTLPAGTFTNHVSLAASSTRDGRPWPATTGEGTVTVDGADLTLAKSHTGDFTEGDKGRTYALVASNAGNQTSSGPVSVTDTLPSGLSATSIEGDGWDCTTATLTCTRSDTLATGASYPKIVVTVDVARDAPASVVNTAAVTHAGENKENDGAVDPTTIAPRPAPQADPDPPKVDPNGGTDGPSGNDPRGNEPGGQKPGDTTPPRDLTAPAFSGLRITKRAFPVSGRGKGTAFVY